MANIIPNSFRGALFEANHNFKSGGNTFKISLYTTNPYSRFFNCVFIRNLETVK